MSNRSIDMCVMKKKKKRRRRRRRRRKKLVMVRVKIYDLFR